MEQVALQKYEQIEPEPPLSTRAKNLSRCHPQCPSDCPWTAREGMSRRCRMYTGPAGGTVLWSGKKTCFFYGAGKPAPVAGATDEGMPAIRKDGDEPPCLTLVAGSRDIDEEPSSTNLSFEEIPAASAPC